MNLRVSATVSIVALATLGCGGADESTPPQDDDPGNAALLIESTLPGPNALVARNQKVTITFHEPVIAETLVVELAGQAVALATLDDREFRFVPFPLLAPDAAYDVRIASGVEDVTGQILDTDLTWTFRTEPGAVEEEAAPPLTEAEIALIHSGDGDTPMALVTDYANLDSALYDISPLFDVTSEHLPLFVDRMMTSVVEHDGIGLAAPQVGINRRIFVARVAGTWQAFVNPAVMDWNTEVDQMVEGCLSVPGDQVNVARPQWIDVSYTRPDGTVVALEYHENVSNNVFPARLWLHEFDHLNGILLIDRMGNPPPELP
jgi:peptide deformylase